MNYAIYADNKIRGIANKNPHESLRGVTITNRPRHRTSRRIYLNLPM